MRQIIAIGLIGIGVLFSAAVSARDVHVQGYTKKDGTYVAPYNRTAPDSNPYNNYSTKGNVNPYTGQVGTKEPTPYNSYGSVTPAPSPYAASPYNSYEAPQATPFEPAYGGYGSNRGSSYDNTPSTQRRSGYGR